MTLSPRLAASTTPSLRLSPGQLEVRDRVLSRLADGTYPCEDVPCICGTDHPGHVIAARDRYGLPVTTLLCPQCGLMRTSPRPTEAAMARFYDEDYRDLYTGPGNAQSLFDSQVARGRGLVQVLGNLLAGVDTVYEVGCGAGGLLLPMAKAGKRVAGVDLGGEYLEVGRQHGLDLVHGRAETLLEHRGEPADLVMLMHVLEHFLDLPTEIAQTVELVKPGGFLLVEVPGIASIAGAYRGDILLYLQNAHTYHFTAKTLTYVLQCAGLDVLLSTEDAIAIARRPVDYEAGFRPHPGPPGEARRVMQLLAELEKKRIMAGRAA